MMLAWLVLIASLNASATDPEAVPATEPESPEESPAEPAVFVPQFAGQCTPVDPNYDLEVLYDEARFEEGLKLAEQRLAGPSPTPDLYWMKVRFMYEIGEKSKPPDPLAFYQEMLDTVEAGLKVAPGDRHLLFGRGVAMGRIGTTRGVLSSLFLAKDVESSWLTVAQDKTYHYASIGGQELLPCDAFHALGIYYRLVPDFWIVQMIAGTRGSLTKSVEWHLRATQCKPRDVSNWKELGASQLCLGQKNRDDALRATGVQSLERGAALATHNERQRIDKRHSLAMVADPSLACGHSRDGQQDLDEKKLEAKGGK